MCIYIDVSNACNMQSCPCPYYPHGVFQTFGCKTQRVTPTNCKFKHSTIIMSMKTIKCKQNSSGLWSYSNSRVVFLWLFDIWYLIRGGVIFNVSTYVWYSYIHIMKYSHLPPPICYSNFTYWFWGLNYLIHIG